MANKTLYGIVQKLGGAAEFQIVKEGAAFRLHIGFDPPYCIAPCGSRDLECEMWYDAEHDARIMFKNGPSENVIYGRELHLSINQVSSSGPYLLLKEGPRCMSLNEHDTFANGLAYFLSDRISWLE